MKKSIIVLGFLMVMVVNLFSTKLDFNLLSFSGIGVGVEFQNEILYNNFELGSFVDSYCLGWEIGASSMNLLQKDNKSGTDFLVGVYSTLRNKIKTYYSESQYNSLNLEVGMAWKLYFFSKDIEKNNGFGFWIGAFIPLRAIYYNDITKKYEDKSAVNSYFFAIPRIGFSISF